MKSNPALPGGLLTSKPTWSNVFGCSATSVFLFSVLRDSRNDKLREEGKTDQAVGKAKQAVQKAADTVKKAVKKVIG